MKKFILSLCCISALLLSATTFANSTSAQVFPIQVAANQLCPPPACGAIPGSGQDKTAFCNCIQSNAQAECNAWNIVPDCSMKSIMRNTKIFGVAKTCEIAISHCSSINQSECTQDDNWALIQNNCGFK